MSGYELLERRAAFLELTRVETRLDGVEGEMRGLKTEFRTLRAELPSISAETMREVLRERDR